MKPFEAGGEREGATRKFVVPKQYAVAASFKVGGIFPNDLNGHLASPS